VDSEPKLRCRRKLQAKELQQLLLAKIDPRMRGRFRTTVLVSPVRQVAFPGEEETENAEWFVTRMRATTSVAYGQSGNHFATPN